MPTMVVCRGAGRTTAAAERSADNRCFVFVQPDNGVVSASAAQGGCRTLRPPRSGQPFDQRAFVGKGPPAASAPCCGGPQYSSSQSAVAEKIRSLP
jgi:hypothetical protein